MREEKYQPKMPDIMEAIFDAGYLIFDLVATILFFIYAKGNTLFYFLYSRREICYLFFMEY